MRPPGLCAPPGPLPSGAQGPFQAASQGPVLCNPEAPPHSRGPAPRPPPRRALGRPLHPVPPSAAHSLMCFSCTDQKSNFYCLKPTMCSSTDNYCVTISAAAGIGECWPGLPAPGPRLPARRPPPLHSRPVSCRREHGGLWPQPEQGLLPGLPRTPQHQPRGGVHGHLLLPELPVQHQRGRRRAAGQRHRAGRGAPAQPAGGPAAARTLTAEPCARRLPQLRKESPAPPTPPQSLPDAAPRPQSPPSGLSPAPASAPRGASCPSQLESVMWSVTLTEGPLEPAAPGVRADLGEPTATGT